MILYVELWNARPAWLALSQQERGAYMAQLAPAIGQLLSAGIEIVGWSLNDADTPHRSAHQYLAAGSQRCATTGAGGGTGRLASLF